MLIKNLYSVKSIENTKNIIIANIQLNFTHPIFGGHFPDNPIILYTSREHSGNIFQYITNDKRYKDTLFLIDKWKKDTEFISVLKKLIGG